MGICSCCIKICTCCSAQIAKCVLGAVNGILITVGVILAIIGCILNWGGNLVYQLISAALSSLGSSTAGSSVKASLSINDLQTVLGTWIVYVSYAGIALLVVGLFLIATGLIGSIGACCNSKILIIVIRNPPWDHALAALPQYIVIMAILALACAGVAAGYIINKNMMRTTGATEMKSLVTNKYKGRNNPDEFTNILDLIQARVPCCGVENYTDFMAGSWNRTYQLSDYSTVYLTYPISCCKISGGTFKPDNENCTMAPTSANSNYMVGGCYTLLWNAFDNYSAYATYGLFIAAGVIGCIAVLAIIILINLEKSVT